MNTFRLIRVLNPPLSSAGAFKVNFALIQLSLLLSSPFSKRGTGGFFLPVAPFQAEHYSDKHSILAIGQDLLAVI
jgi:hypothetical protein